MRTQEKVKKIYFKRKVNCQGLRNPDLGGETLSLCVHGR